MGMVVGEGTRAALLGHPANRALSARDSDEDSGKIRAPLAPSSNGARIVAPFGHTAIEGHFRQG
jgi:hypothetical protein